MSILGQMNLWLISFIRLLLEVWPKPYILVDMILMGMLLRCKWGKPLNSIKKSDFNFVAEDM